MPNTPVLALVDEPTRARLLASGPVRRYSKGSWLFHEGDPARQVWLVTEGVVKVHKVAESGRVSVLGFREAGCLLGEQSALDGEPMIASASALTDVTAVVMPSSRFGEILESTPALAGALLSQMNGRLRQAARLLHDISTADAVTRVANRLVELTADTTPSSAMPTRVQLPVSQQDLAEWAGLSREAVVRSLRILRDEGIIETGRMKVVVLDKDRLEARGRVGF